MRFTGSAGSRKSMRGCAIQLLLLLALLYIVLGKSTAVSASESRKNEADTVQTEEEVQQEQETEEQEQTVRVAYVISKNFQEGEEGEYKYGYGYEYLQKIAYYTGWRYEYVYGTFQECLEKLIQGEVDLMSNISYLEERAELFDYSDEEQGEECFYVFGHTSQNLYQDPDWSLYDTIRIGVAAGRYSKDLAENWCQKNHLDYELKEYGDMGLCSDDLENGVIDIVIASEVNTGDNWIALEELEKRPYYYGVTKTRPDLLEELNQAMRAIKAIDPFFNNELRGKYITSPSTSTILLSEKEEQWLSDAGQLRIGYLNDYMPYCGKDDESGELSGMLGDILSYITKTYNIEYQSVAFDSYEELKTALNQGTIDVIFPVYGEYSVAEEENMMISDAVTRSTMMLFNGAGDIAAMKTIAVTDTDPFQEKYASIYYPDAQWVRCENLVDCMEAVLEGRADFTIAETAKVNELTNIIYNEWTIQKADLQQFMNISFAVRWGENSLLSVLNKGLQGVPDSLITNSLILHSQEEIHYTLADFLRSHIVAVFLVMLAVFVIIIGSIILKLRSQRQVLKAEYEAEAAQWKAEHDVLTGLFNRTAFQKMSQSMKMTHQPVALLILDVDKFKNVNDTYGHETGDRALVRVANVLNRQFRPDDQVIRFAGDEFIVLMKNVPETDSHIITSKIDSINRILRIPDGDLPQLSISAGIAFSENGYRDELFQQADQAMYRIKKNGGGGCSVA